MACHWYFHSRVFVELLLFLIIINDQKEGEISEIIKLVADTKLVIIVKIKSPNLFTGKCFFNGEFTILELFI